ncbi:MAG: hypothetical protein ACE5JL_12695 [Dehalococcoidia bacterium]
MNRKSPSTYTPAYREVPCCLICGESLQVRMARGRRSGKPFLMLLCGQDGRHFRAFINHQPYVRQVLERLENPERPEVRSQQ